MTSSSMPNHSTWSAAQLADEGRDQPLELSADGRGLYPVRHLAERLGYTASQFYHVLKALNVARYRPPAGMHQVAHIRCSELAMAMAKLNPCWNPLRILLAAMEFGFGLAPLLADKSSCAQIMGVSSPVFEFLFPDDIMGIRCEPGRPPRFVVEEVHVTGQWIREVLDQEGDNLGWPRVGIEIGLQREHLLLLRLKDYRQEKPLVVDTSEGFIREANVYDSDAFKAFMTKRLARC